MTEKPEDKKKLAPILITDPNAELLSDVKEKEGEEEKKEEKKEEGDRPKYHKMEQFDKNIRVNLENKEIQVPKKRFKEVEGIRRINPRIGNVEFLLSKVFPMVAFVLIIASIVFSMVASSNRELKFLFNIGTATFTSLSAITSIKVKGFLNLYTLVWVVCSFFWILNLFFFVIF